MHVQAALKSQYHASLAMLRQAIERCPDEVWLAGDHPRSTWRIAYHALFFTHFYLQPGLEGFVPWTRSRENAQCLEGVPWPPHDMPAVVEPYTRPDMLDYWALCDGMIDEGVDRLDLEAPTCGFPWYDMPKLDHQVLNIRHIQQHVGQLAEILGRAGIDVDWAG